MSQSALQVVPAGDAAAMVVLGEEMSLEMTGRVRALGAAVEGAGLPGVIQAVAAYCTLLIHYDPLEVSFGEVRSLVQRVTAQGVPPAPAEARRREIPLVYGGAHGPDLPAVAEKLRMEEREIVALHSGATFVVCTLGFAPGQPYVVGLPPQLALPRRDSPRERVPLGAVLIANQTVVYPMANPTGWWWIGQTHLRLFDPAADPPTYVQPGDHLRFIPITEEEYIRRGGLGPE